MNLKARWAGLCRQGRRCLARCPVPAMLTGAAVLMAAGTAVRLASGSPFARGMMLQFGNVIPPVWLMSVCWLLWYGVLGAVFAAVMCGGRCDLYTQAARYRGGMLFVCMIFLGFLWYPLFFIAGHVLPALLVHLSVLALCVLTALCYWQYFRVAAIVLFAHAGYLLWLAAVNVAVMLH